MAVSAGDVFYRVQADTKALKSATAQVRKFGQEIQKAATQAQRLSRNLNASYSKLNKTIASTGASQASSSKTAVTALTRQQKSIQGAEKRYAALRKRAMEVGRGDLLGGASKSLKSYNSTLTNTKLTSEQLAKQQLKLNKTFNNAERQIGAVKSQQTALAKQYRTITSAAGRAAEVQNRALISVGRGKRTPQVARLQRQASDALKDFQRVASSQKSTVDQVSKAQARYNTRLANTTREIRRFESGIKSSGGLLRDFADGIKSVGTAFAAFLLFQSAQNAVQGFFAALDRTREINARLQLTADSAGEVNEAFEDVYNIAQRTRTSVDDLAELYAKVQFNAEDLGATTKEVNSLTTAFAAGLSVSGASAQEAAGSTRQFTQAMASGRLQGEEFRSVLENNIAFSRAMADQLAGGSIKELYNMREAGDLTAQSLIAVSSAMENQMITALERMDKTAGYAMVSLSNKAFKLIRSINDTVDVTGGLVAIIETLQSLLEELVIAFGAATSAAIAYGSAMGVARLKTIGFSASLTTLLKPFRAVGKFLTRMSITAANFAKAFTGIVGTLGGSATALVLNRDKMVELEGQTVRLGSVVQALWGYFKEGIGVITGPLMGAFETVKELSQDFVRNFKELILEDMIGSMVTLGAAIAAALSASQKTVDNAIKNLRTIIQRGLNDIFSWIADQIDRIPEWVINITPNLNEKKVKQVTDALRGMYESAQGRDMLDVDFSSMFFEDFIKIGDTISGTLESIAIRAKLLTEEWKAGKIAQEEAREEIEKLRKEAVLAETALADFNKELRNEVKILETEISKGEEAADALRDRMKFEKELEKAAKDTVKALKDSEDVEFTAQEIKAIVAARKEEAESLYEKKRAYEETLRVTKELKSMEEDLRSEQDSINKKYDEYRKLVRDSNKTLSEKRSLLIQIGKKESEELLEHNELYQTQVKIVDELGSSFQSAFESAIISGDKTKDIIRALLDDISMLIIRLGVIAPIMERIKGVMEGFHKARGEGGGFFGSLKEGFTESFAEVGPGVFGDIFDAVKKKGILPAFKDMVMGIPGAVSSVVKGGVAAAKGTPGVLKSVLSGGKDLLLGSGSGKSGSNPLDTVPTIQDILLGGSKAPKSIDAAGSSVSGAITGSSTRQMNVSANVVNIGRSSGTTSGTRKAKIPGEEGEGGEGGTIGEQMKKAVSFLKEKLSGVFDFLKGIFGQVGEMMSSLFGNVSNVVSNIVSFFGDAVSSIFKVVSDLISKAVQVIAKALSSSFAQGGAFSGGRELTAFAQGGVVRRPTVFPMADGMGLMGEAGPEAVMPLQRGSGGRLGVSAEGAMPTIIFQLIDRRTGDSAPIEAYEAERDVTNNSILIKGIVDNRVKEGLNRGTFDRDLNNNFGVSRRGRR